RAAWRRQTRSAADIVRSRRYAASRSWAEPYRQAVAPFPSRSISQSPDCLPLRPWRLPRLSVWKRLYPSRFPAWLADDPVDMPHLAAGAGLGFAVEMRLAIPVESAGHHADLIADEILHDHIGHAPGIAQRPAGNGADMLLELVGKAHGLGPVARIVDPRRDLVDQKS